MFSMDLGPGASAELVVVTLHGELDLMYAPDLAIALKSITARNRWIIVDLAALEFIDATGVAALSRGRRLARNSGGGLLLAAPHGIVRRVLTLIWEADGSFIEASVAAAATCTESFRSSAGPVAARGDALPDPKSMPFQAEKVTG